MTLKEYLEENLQTFIRDGVPQIRISDADYMQGVELLTDKPGTTADIIINDKPVIRFWNYNVMEVLQDDENIIYITVQASEPPQEPPTATGYTFS